MKRIRVVKKSKRRLGQLLFNVAKADDIKPAIEAAFKSGKPHLVEIEGKR